MITRRQRRKLWRASRHLRRAEQLVREGTDREQRFMMADIATDLNAVQKKVMRLRNGEDFYT